MSLGAVTPEAWGSEGAAEPMPNDLPLGDGASQVRPHSGQLQGDGGAVGRSALPCVVVVAALEAVGAWALTPVAETM